MSEDKTGCRFKAKLLRPAGRDPGLPRAFVVLPKEASDTLPRRGRTTVDGRLNGHAFRVTLEPDGRLSHWLPLSDALLETTDLEAGDDAAFEILPLANEPEPEVPADLALALAEAPDARAVWDDTTPVAQLDWIHWITSAKQDKTRAKRIRDACDKLASGKRRVCCFDPSGYYSKAFGAPDAAD